MPTILQLSATSWLNLDTVARIEQEWDQWHVWICGDYQWLTLSPEEGEVLASHLMQTQSVNQRAYKDVQRLRRAMPTPAAPDAEGEPHA